ncbi:hypothetical protein [Achromobacter aegrifaciens]|uniref:hypothetical protein n=1 Tax=Achromobacter aegrifaciens TaxID=1287736 RepID=UPI000F73A7C4|nr:hypothetical protein [Achromobacter aegrifaciens]
MDTFIPAGRAWKFNQTDFINPPREFTYVQPTYHQSPHKQVQQCHYVIVSAPGAVGKSAFGLHLAQTKNAMLWDLSKLRLGSNTFIGSVLQAVGTKNLGEFLDSIASGETTLVFDAFDEAELHSGWSGVEEFLRDVIAHTGNGVAASVIFLARRSTAEMLELALGELLPEGKSFTTAGIGFFSKAGATEFVLAQVESIKGRAYLHRQDAVLREKAREAFSMPVAGEAGVSNADEWHSTEHERFFGYAPVLQTIARLLADSENPFTLSFDQTRSGYAAIVADILERIQNREKEKFHAAAIQRFTIEKNVDMSAVYSGDDQHSRLLGYLNCDPSEAYAVPAALDAKTSSELEEMVRSFLPQHPFLSGNDFAGPAFRDFVLAKGLTSDDRRLSSELWIEERQPLATPILATLYHATGGGVADASDVELLYESANSGSISGQSSLLLFVSEDDPSHLSIEIASNEGNALGESLSFRAKNPPEISFARRISNAQLVTSGVVSFGRKDQSFDFADSEVSAQRIRFEAARVRVRAEESGCNRLDSAEAIQSPAGMKLDVQSQNALCVVAPNSKSFPWTSYSEDSVSGPKSVDVNTTLHVMARVLGWFRKDRRKEYGRYKDLIVKHVVGSSPTARYALGFIQHIGALSESGNLYFVDTEKLDSLELSWQKIRNGTVSDAAKTAVESYLRATPQPPQF